MALPPKDSVIERAYGHIPREVGYYAEWGYMPAWRGFKYYWFKLKRKLTR